MHAARVGGVHRRCNTAARRSAVLRPQSQINKTSAGTAIFTARRATNDASSQPTWMKKSAGKAY